MARTPISVGSIPEAGLDVVAGATFATMAAGANNGVTFDYTTGALAALRNTTGATAVFTVKVPTPAAFTAKGVTVPDVPVSVPNLRTVLYALSAIFQQPDGSVAVDCDAAGQIAIIRP